jgi:uncharacterized protein
MALERVERIHSALPIFRLPFAAGAVLYTPGFAVRERDADAEVIERLASGAEAAWHSYVERPFVPECLTLYLSNQCNLGCSYCYSAPIDASRERWRQQATLNEDAAVAAARLVAANCEAKGKPFSLIFHGGGEPTQHWESLTRLRRVIGEIAATRDLDLWSYIATNGVIGEARLDWLAAQFSTIGLSCDGPPDIQDRHRPTATGAPTSAAVERAARRLAERGADFHVRVTITKSSAHRQVEIIEYCVRRLGARTVRFEPAYLPRPETVARFEPDDAPMFVEHFMAARAAAHAAGAELHMSGVRLNEIHGAYCNPLRDVLQLSPDGRASACFLTADGDRVDDELFALGRYDAAAGAFVIDESRAATLRQRAGRVPARCHECVNVYHCARDCPDVCSIVSDPVTHVTPGFRCRVQKQLAHELIKEWVNHGRTESL